MKRFARAILVVGAVLAIGATAWAGHQTFEGYRVAHVLLNGKPIESDVPGILLNGRTMLPLRVLAEAIGARVEWDGDTYTATLTSPVHIDKTAELETALKDLAAAKKDAESAKAELATAKRDLATAQAEVKMLTAATTTKPAPAAATPTIPPLKTAKEIQGYLQANLATVMTPAGKLNLTYEVFGPNDSDTVAYDYDVTVDWSPSLFFTFSLGRIEHSLTAPAGGREESIKILKEHSQKIYEVMAKALPGKKIEGSFFRSWYRYPTIRVDLQIESHLRWQNYDEGPVGSGKSEYANATLGQFHFVSDDR